MSEVNKAITLQQAKTLYDDLRERQENIPSAENIVMVQDQQPTIPANKVWLTETPPAGVDVPTYEEFTGVIAPDYADLDFPVSAGEHCIHNGVLYTAVQNINASEAWTAAHWEAGSVSSKLTEISTAITQKAPVIVNSTKGAVAKADGAIGGYPVKSLKIAIQASLSGTGKPSPQNMYTVTGWTGMTIKQSGEDTTEYDTFTVDWQSSAGTVYCGEFDALTGVLTITGKCFILSFENMNNDEDYPGWRNVTELRDCFTGYNGGAVIIASNMEEQKTVETANSSIIRINTNNNNNIIFIGKSYLGVSSQTEAKQVYAGKSLILVSPLITPITVQLDPVILNNLVDGINNIWANTGVTEFSFNSDTKKYVDDVIAKESSANDPLFKIKKYPEYICAFLHVGCIGDSLASGESAYKQGSTVKYVDQYQYSWGQYLARATGNTYYNFSAGGYTTKEWLTSSKATDCFDGNHDCEAYIIGLGINDKNLPMTVGTSADINLSDYTQNADTFYGNYGKIIQKLQEHEPKAKIFVITNPNNDSEYFGYNTAVRDMATIFNNVYVLDLFTYGYDIINTGFVKANRRSGHYNAIAYKYISQIIATYIDWIIENNRSEFEQVEFIGTDYVWTS